MSVAMLEPSSASGAGSYDKRGRFWAVTDAAGQLVCLAVYKKGAQEVLRRLDAGGDQSAIIRKDITTEQTLNRR